MRYSDERVKGRRVREVLRVHGKEKKGKERNKAIPEEET